MKKIDILKAGVGLVVSIGVGAIVGNVVKSTTPDDIGKIKKACVWVGALVVSSIIKDNVKKYVDEKIDDGVKLIEDVIEEKDPEVVEEG